MSTGASQRLPSILMTAIVTALGCSTVLGSGDPGREIEGRWPQSLSGVYLVLQFLTS